MRVMTIPHLAAIGAVVAALASSAAQAEEPANFQPACVSKPVNSDPRAFNATCEIGPLGPLKVTRVTVQKEGGRAPVAEATFLPFDIANKPTAVLFVVDRSDRRRARTVALGAADAIRMMEATRSAPGFRFGLATVLGDRLDVATAIGASRDEIVRSVSALRADSVGADNSRAVLDAIRLLAQSPADRHILVLATDGKPEDKSLARDDIIRGARNAGVVVVGIGYRERSGEGLELPSLKKLAEDTGGFYAEPLLPASRVDDAVIARFGQFATSGGVAAFPLDRTDPRGRYLITVEIDGGRSLTGVYTADITLPGLASAKVQTSPVQPISAPPKADGPKTAANAPPVVADIVKSRGNVPEPAEPGSVADLLARMVSYGADLWMARPLTIIGVLLTLVLIFAGIIGYLRRRASRIKIFAWIELLDQRRTRFPVTTAGVRLGRHSDNDIRFKDKSVHRYHAVLQRDAGTGVYSIADVSRNQTQSNGVMVNGELVHQPVVLGNGDTIELGDVSFRFVYT